MHYKDKPDALLQVDNVTINDIDVDDSFIVRIVMGGYLENGGLA